MDHQTQSLKGVYTLFKPQKPSLPILFDSPHSGTYLPHNFDYKCKEDDLLSLSDLFIDELFKDVTEDGHTFLQAETSRSFIDFNRSLDDIDLELLNDMWPYPVSNKGRSRYGVGLIFRNAKNGAQIYNKKLTAAEIKSRIDTYYAPYHKRLTQELSLLHDKHGEYLHINCHSFPSKQGIRDLPDIVLGDRCATTCHPDITNRVKEIIEAYGYSVSINHPYQGQELIKATGSPHNNKHSIQIEINRRLYMNEKKLIKNLKFNDLKNNINSISKDIVSQIFTQQRVAD